jgi:hypothetical protein
MIQISIAPKHESSVAQRMIGGAQDTKDRNLNGGPTPCITRPTRTGSHPQQLRGRSVSMSLRHLGVYIQ